MPNVPLGARWALASSVVGAVLLAAWSFGNPVRPLGAELDAFAPGPGVPASAPSAAASPHGTPHAATSAKSEEVLIVDRCRVHLRDVLKLAAERNGIVV